MTKITESLERAANRRITESGVKTANIYGRKKFIADIVEKLAKLKAPDLFLVWWILSTAEESGKREVGSGPSGRAWLVGRRGK